MRNKITATICLVLMLSAAGCEVKRAPELESGIVSERGSLTKICVDGYVFLRFYADRSGGITQVWERDPVSGAVPMRCTKAPKEPQQNQTPDAASHI